MDSKILISILTPTFNRAEKLIELYNSLLNQSNHKFNWIIIDDGSIDNTKEVVDQFNTNKFAVNYYYKENGGKHTAHNLGLDFINTELTMVVDSDDILTKDAVQSIYDEWLPVKDKGLCGVSFLKSDKKGNISGLEFPNNNFIGNFIDIRINRNDISEKAEIWVTDILRKYPFPVFEGEKYVGEGAIWSSIAKKYDMLFVNKIIYIYEYEQSGLTLSGRRLRIKNPFGGIFAAKVALSKEFKMSMKIKKMILYICYGFFAKLSIREMYKDSPMKTLYVLLFPLGITLFFVWKIKYFESN